MWANNSATHGWQPIQRHRNHARSTSALLRGVLRQPQQDGLVALSRQNVRETWVSALSRAREEAVSSLPNHGMPVPMAHPWLPGFLDPLIVTPQDNGRDWKVVGSFQYETSIIMAAYGPMVIEIEDGFTTDFTSSPRLTWWLVPPWGTYGKGSVVHDDLYRTPGLCTRRQADAVLFEAMTYLGVPWLTRWAIWLAVRLGGRSSYKGGLG